MPIVWTPELVNDATEMIQEMSATEVANRLSEKYQINFTKNSVLGKLYRTDKEIPKYKGCRTKGNHTPRPKKANKKPVTALDLYYARKTKRVFKKPETSTYFMVTSKGRPIVPSYKPLGTCQYIGDVPGKCGKPSHGPWCEDHRKIVFKSL